jgi:hypothetical protein
MIDLAAVGGSFEMITELVQKSFMDEKNIAVPIVIALQYVLYGTRTSAFQTIAI